MNDLIFLFLFSFSFTAECFNSECFGFLEFLVD
jgi:hypothetical protein